MTINESKPVLVLLSSIVFLCFLSYLVSETLLAKNFSVFSLFVSYSCLLLFSSLALNRQAKKRQNTNKSNIVLSSDDAHKLCELVGSTIREDLDVVKQELAQIKELVSKAVLELIDNFNGLADNVNEQQRLVNLLVDAINKMDEKEISYDLRARSEKISNCCNSAIIALQFEDIVTQLSDNSMLHANCVDVFFDNMTSNLKALLSKSQQQPVAMQQLIRCITDADIVRLEMLTQQRKTITQNDVSEGSTELF